MNELLEISKQLTRAANRWPLSEERRLDLLRFAKRVRFDAMTDQDIELLLISAAVNGCRYIDDFTDETGLSRKEAVVILDQMWSAGTLDKGEESIHGRGRRRVVFTLAGDLASKENNAFLDDLDLLP